MRRLSSLCVALLVGLSLVIASFGLSPSAQAVPDAPQGLEASNTTLSWNRVPGATSYYVEVSNSSAFTSVAWNATTTNVQVVPEKAVPSGHVYWRVRSKDASGVSAWGTSSFTMEEMDGPTDLQPDREDTSPLLPPEEYPALTWSAIPGAAEYEIWLGTDPSFIDPTRYKSYTTKSTAYNVEGLAPATYYWQVRATLGAGSFTKFSEVATFAVGSIAPVTEASWPLANHFVEDAVFDWDPIPGAVSYELEVDTDDDFDTLLFSKGGILGTSYARPETLNNDQYFWRVRGVDTFGNKSPWPTAPFEFHRAWPQQPEPVSPGTVFRNPLANGVATPGPQETVSGQVIFDWEPVRLASFYVLQISSDPNFVTDVAQCQTTHTSFTPTRVTNDCWHPTGSTKYYWRVKGIDGPKVDVTKYPETDIASAQVNYFYYAEWAVDTSSMEPSTGTTGPAPTLTWDPVPGAATYRVIIEKTDATSVETATTGATSYTPRKNLYPKDGEPVTYRWDVVPVDAYGLAGNPHLISARNTFTVDASGGPAAAPELAGPPSGLITDPYPTLEWTAMPTTVESGRTNPTKYRVQYREQGTTAWNLAETTVQPAWQPTTAEPFLADTTYEWRVATADGSAVAASFRDFTVRQLASVTGITVSLTGNATGDATCDGGLPEICTALPDTPVLRWNPVPGATRYRVNYLADREGTNPIKVDGYTDWLVGGTAFQPKQALPDSQAGTAYYFRIDACYDMIRCAPKAHAQHAFAKSSAKVELTDAVSYLDRDSGTTATDAPTCQTPAGAEGDVVGDDVTLRWKDWYLTNRQSSGAGTGVADHARLEAYRYNVQVATDAEFTAASTVDSVQVDQTEYTSFAKTYPEGPLWWRVQAVDGSNNTLRWSDARRMYKCSPAPNLIEPASGADSTGMTFAWKPLPFASAYEVEIYRNADTNASSANKVGKTYLVKSPTLNLPNPLPVANDYIWRIRRKDAQNRAGVWSAGPGSQDPSNTDLWRRFNVVGQAPILEMPSLNAVVAPNGGLFTWSWPAGAPIAPASYRFQRRAAGSATVAETTATVATAYAPKSTLPDGASQWRVVAFDTAGSELGASDWRDYQVSGAPVAEQKPSIEGAGKVDTLLTATSPTWNLPNVAETWQWLRDGRAISNATEPTYKVTPADVGKKLTVRVVGSVPGYKDGTTTSDDVVTGVIGDPLLPVTTPVISGSGKVGTELAVGPVEWKTADDVTLADAKVSYQWYRGATPIARATASTYLVQPDDVNHDISVELMATAPGYAEGKKKSNAIFGAAGDAVVNSAPPTISGKLTVGSRLSASPGTWTGRPSYSYVWLRDGVEIPGATSSSYIVAPNDAGHPLSVRVTASSVGYLDGVATSASSKVAKMVATTSLTTSKSRIRMGKRVRLTVTLTAPDATPIGVVVLKIKRGTKTTTKKLAVGPTGIKSVSLRLKKPGKTTVKANYKGTSNFTSATSSKVKIKVVR